MQEECQIKQSVGSEAAFAITHIKKSCVYNSP